MRKRDILAIIILVALSLLMLKYAMASEWEYPKDLEFLGKLPPMQAGDCSEKATGAQYFCILLLDISDGSQYLTVWTNEKVLHEVVRLGLDGSLTSIYLEAKKMGL